MTDNDPRVTVYGATGHTGRLVCREFARRGRDFVAAGRRMEALQKLSQQLGNDYGAVPTLRSASVDEPKALDDVLARTEILVNCAGPFTDLGPPVARAALRNDVHYLDTTGEQGYIRWIRDEISGAAERRALVFLPACAYEYVTGTIASALALERGARRIGVCYRVQDFATSTGTKRSIVRSVAANGVSYVDGRYVERTSGSRLFDVPVPTGDTYRAAWFAGGEPLFVPLLGEVDTVESCLAVGRVLGGLLSLASGPLSTLARLSEPLVDRLVGMVTDESKRGEADESGAPFEVVAFDPESPRWYSVLAGFEPYLTTAKIIAEAATRFDHRAEGKVGFQTPATLFEPREFAESVDVEIEVNEAL